MTQKKKDEFDRLQDSIAGKVQQLWGSRPSAVFCSFSFGEGEDMQVGYITSGDLEYLPGILAHSFSGLFRGVDDPSWFFTAIITEMAVIRGELVIGEDGMLYPVELEEESDGQEAGGVQDSSMVLGGHVGEFVEGYDTELSKPLEHTSDRRVDSKEATEGESGVSGDEEAAGSELP